MSTIFILNAFFENGAVLSNHIRESIVINKERRFKKWYQTIQETVHVEIINQKSTRVFDPLTPLKGIKDLMGQFDVTLLQTYIFSRYIGI